MIQSFKVNSANGQSSCSSGCREMIRAHCFGDKVQHVQKIAGFFNDVWSREIGTSPDSNYVRYCPPQEQTDNNTGIRIRRNGSDAETQLHNASHWMSYAAKVNEKEKTPEGCRMFGFTQIPKA